MSRKFREWKSDIRFAHENRLFPNIKPTLARYKSCKRQEQRIDKYAKRFIRENWICYKHSQKRRRRIMKKEDLISDLRNSTPAIDHLSRRLVMDMIVASINDGSKKAQERRCCRYSRLKRRRGT